MKFAAFAHEAAGLEVLASGQIEGLGAKATFLAETASGSQERLCVRRKPRPRGPAAPRWPAIMSSAGGSAALARDVVAVGHRIVHGGPDFCRARRGSTRPSSRNCGGTSRSRRCMRRTISPASRRRSKYSRRRAEVACFDTGFRRSHPFVADTFALPRSYYDEGVRHSLPRPFL